MLARTADNLYWAARYVERADFSARLLDAAARLSALPSSYTGSHGSEWRSCIEAADVTDGFALKGVEPTEEAVRDFMAFDRANPSSIVSCLDRARANARAVRTALTATTREELNGFLDWTKKVSLTFDGSAMTTMLRNDAYYFLRLGTTIERADNTARLLDVKYHLLLPEREPVGGGLDFFQWTTLLREVSALTAYRWVYREEVKPWLVADLLLLNRQLPRSVASCYDQIVSNLDALASDYGRSGPSQRLASTIYSRLASLRMDEVFASGLHEFINEVIAGNAQLGATIAAQYLS